MLGQRHRRRTRARAPAAGPSYAALAQQDSTGARSGASLSPASGQPAGQSSSRRRKSRRRGNRSKTTSTGTLGVKLRRAALAIRRVISTRRTTSRARALSYASAGIALTLFVLTFYFAISAHGSPFHLRGRRGVLYYIHKPPPPASRRRIRPTVKRRSSTEEEPMPILINSITSSGGTARLLDVDDDSLKSENKRSKDRDYGGLDIDLLPEGVGREILTSSNESEDDEDDSSSSSLDSYYAFDDDHVRHKTCRRVSWHKYYHPNCNNVHEAFLLDAAAGFEYISHGYFRDVFSLTENTGEETISKALRLRKHAVDYESLEYVRMDALVMERLTASPRIVDVYGHCGVTVYTESLPGEIEQNAVPVSHMKQRDVDKHFGPQNDWSPELKLSLSLGFAEALSDLHGFRDGVIVHDDVQLCQFLLDKNGNLKLNDFNRAEIMIFDEDKGEYCRYRNDGAYGNLRSPEEWHKRPLNEQIDTFSFGNLVYELLTGLEPFYTIEDDEVVHRKMKRGDTAYIDDRYRTRSFAEAKMVELIENCFIFDPDERITIFQAVKFLREALEENERHKQAGIGESSDEMERDSH